MPRAGLDPNRVAEREALRIVDEAGIGALSVASVAARLGVKRPSLYNHLRSMEGLRDSLRAIVFEEIAEAAENASPRTGRRGIFALERALREYVVAHPRRIDLLLENVEDAEGPLRSASQRLLQLVMELLGSYGLSGSSHSRGADAPSSLDRICAAGVPGGYAIDVPVEESSPLRWRQCIAPSPTKGKAWAPVRLASRRRRGEGRLYGKLTYARIRKDKKKGQVFPSYASPHRKCFQS